MQFDLMWLAPVGSIFALIFSAYLILKILKEPRGGKEIIEIQDAIEEGSRAYIKRQYGVVGIFFAIVVALLFVMYRGGYLTVYVPFAFLSGGFFSAKQHLATRVRLGAPAASAHSLGATTVRVADEWGQSTDARLQDSGVS